MRGFCNVKFWTIGNSILRICAAACSVDLRDFKLSPPYKWHLHSCRMLCSVDWELVNDVSEQAIGHIFKSQAALSFFGLQVLVCTLFTRRVFRTLKKLLWTGCGPVS
jgi:hypothetical protein